MKQCKDCKEIKPLTEFKTCGSYKDKIYYRGECRLCSNKFLRENPQYLKKYRNSEKGKAKIKAYKQTRKYRMQQTAYEVQRCKTDRMFRLKKRLRDRLQKALKSKKWVKTTKFSQYIGCSYEKLRTHIESQFKEGMSWDNYGKWHLDHITPLASAKDEKEMYKLAHYTNIQPLWAEENQKKSDKII